VKNSAEEDDGGIDSGDRAPAAQSPEHFIKARAQGVNYYEVTQAAVRGDKKALKTFFSIGADGAAAEEYIGVTSVVIRLIGDDAFAEFLRGQPRDFRKGLPIGWELGVAYPFDTEEYFRQHFPKSAKLLFGVRS
jgi:hypothetical protein